MGIRGGGGDWLVWLWGRGVCLGGGFVVLEGFGWGLEVGG